MQRNRTEGRREDDEDALEKPESAPSFLTARELQSRDPAKGADADGDGESSIEKQKPKGRRAPRS